MVPNKENKVKLSKNSDNDDDPKKSQIVNKLSLVVDFACGHHNRDKFADDLCIFHIPKTKR